MHKFELLQSEHNQLLQELHDQASTLAGKTAEASQAVELRERLATTEARCVAIHVR